MRPFLDAVRPGVPLRVGYLGDAQVAYVGAPFVAAERRAIEILGHEIVDITVRDLTSSAFAATLSTVDAVYVAGGSTFALREALAVSGGDVVLAERVRDGLPYIGCSAGSIIVGPDITPASLMDDPADAPSLTDFAGLHLIERTVIPHADGLLEPYPPSLIDATLARYGSSHLLLPLRDDQALLVDGDREAVIDSEAAAEE